MDKLPTISIVTPSFNQAPFLEATIESILSQNYPKLEYIIIDGGSTDGSVDIIRKYEHRLAYWVSEPDKGQYDAINKGFAKSTGQIMAWLNADDKYLPWTLDVVSQIFREFHQLEWLTTLFPLIMDERGHVVRCDERTGFSASSFFAGHFLPGGNWHAEGCIQQESTFWSRSLWERAGAHVDSNFRYASDFELWARFFAHKAELCGAAVPLAAFRCHSTQKTAHHMKEYFAEAQQALARHGGEPRNRWESFVLSKLSKLNRYFSRLYTMKSKKMAKICRHRGREGGWVIRS